MDNSLLAAWYSEFGDLAAYAWRDRVGADGVEPGGRRRELRRRLVAEYSFAVPSEEALDMIASFGPIVEIGAGRGYWAGLLRKRGADVAAYDVLGREFLRWFPLGTLGGVVRGGAEKAAEHPDRTLLLVWPPHGDAMATMAVRAYQAHGGRRIVYVGEGRYGWTADIAFFDAIHWGHPRRMCTDRENWHVSYELPIPQWPGISDSLVVVDRGYCV